MKKIFLIFIISTSYFINFGQNNDIQMPLQYNYTEDLVYTEDFSGAIRLYNEMISFDPKNPVFYYKLGFAYLNTFGKQDSAIIFFKKSLNLYTPKYRSDISPSEVKLYLARAYRLNNQIDSSALLLFELKRENTNQQFLGQIDKEIELMNRASKLFDHIKDLPPAINSSYTEHSPVYLRNKNILLFTSRKQNNISILLPDGQWAENIYESQYIDSAWQEGQMVTELSSQTNDATCFFTYDNQHLLLYKDDENGSIYTTTLNGDKWTTPVKMPWPINTHFRETHASMTGTDSIIYFTSNRPGGIGGIDIWSSKLQPNGEWSKPFNLGQSVNTKEDEESPNISEDGKTLYFSSNGRGGYGGFDIFKTQMNDFGTWKIAENLGYPINSADDDLFFVPYNSQNIAFFSSYRENKNGKADVFLFNLDTSDLDKKIINYGFIVDQNQEPLSNAEITIINNRSKQRFYARPTSSGKFIFLTEPKNQYTISVSFKNNIVYTDQYTAENTDQKQVFYKKIILNVVN